MQCWSNLKVLKHSKEKGQQMKTNVWLLWWLFPFVLAVAWQAWQEAELVVRWNNPWGI